MKKNYLFIVLFALIAYSELSAQVTIVKSPFYLYNYLGVVNDKLLFFATDTTNDNYELWSSDGTEEGTQLVKDILPGTAGSILSNSYWGPQYKDKEPVIFNNELYFLATDDVHGMEIWKSDGTTEGTVLLKDIYPGTGGYFSPEFNYPYFTKMGGKLYFAATDGTHGFELWKTDGTEIGTEMVKDISTDGIYGSNPEHLINFKEKIYFTARDDSYGYEIYESDGTALGTHLLKDIVTGIDGSMNDGYAGSIDPLFTVSGNYLYFVGRIDAGLPVTFYAYRTDGTDIGTITLNNSLENVAEFTDVDSTCYFSAYDGDDSHSGLWKSDGSAGGTENVETDNIFAAKNFYDYDHALYFSGSNTTFSQFGLYESNGTTSGTQLVKAFEGISSIPEVGDYIADSGSQSFFYRALMKVTETSMSYRYVQTNGTTIGTNVFYGAAPFRGSAFFHGKIYFPAIDTTSAEEWGLYSITPVTLPTEGIENTFLQENNVLIYPNPYSGFTTISYLLAKKSDVFIEVYNILGERIETLVNTKQEEGSYAYKFSAREQGFNAGVYYIKLNFGGKITMKKVVEI